MSTNRASLLAGLRTGGPRSVSPSGYPNQGYVNSTPQTAGPDITAFAAQQRKELNRRSSLMNADLGILDAYQYDAAHVPATAPANELVFAQLQQQQQQQQQQAQFLLLQAQLQAQALQSAYSANGRQQPLFALTPEQQAMQLQIEMLKIQQTALFAQAQAQVQVQQSRNVVPRTAGPAAMSFGNVAPRHRASSLAQVAEGPVTAGIDGRFPNVKSRAVSGLNPNAPTFQMGASAEPVASAPAATASANWRNGTAGSPAPSSISGSTASAKQHESAASWRRPSVARQSSETSEVSHRSATPPTVYVSSPEETGNEDTAESRSVSPPTAFAAGIARAHGSRPQSLQFKLPAALRTSTRDDEGNRSTQDYQVMSPVHDSYEGNSGIVSPAREEAARRLYEGLGIGRPHPGATTNAHGVETARHVSQPVRQPRGPPGGPDELGARNFASRIRSQGLGVLKEHRARRQSQNLSLAIEAY